MNEALAAAPKAKKSVALSGVTAGNTALCTVGRTGNDLAYRGYDILDLAQASVVGAMQTRAELYEHLGYHEYERKLDELFANENEREAG